MERNNIIKEKTFRFALMALVLQKNMSAKHEYVLSNQFLRSATSIGANVEESLAAHSKKDFLSKNVIALKEARESQYWLRLINESHLMNFDVEDLLSEVGEIVAILSSIVKTTKKHLNE
jgi:four helix bundle protein